jgi:CheY-like chemotaxis protein
LALLQQWAGDSSSPLSHLAMVISDIEMPIVDGYTLTTMIRQDERLRDSYILLHTSLSGVFNKDLVQRVGADDFPPNSNPVSWPKRSWPDSTRDWECSNKNSRNASKVLYLLSRCRIWWIPSGRIFAYEVDGDLVHDGERGIGIKFYRKFPLPGIPPLPGTVLRHCTG